MIQKNLHILIFLIYSIETSVLVRPHYKQSWPPMIHALSLWLTSVAFEDQDGGEKTKIGAGLFYFCVCVSL